MKRIVSSVLRSLLFGVYFIHLYAKISLLSVLRFIHILYVENAFSFHFMLKAVFLSLFNFPLSLFQSLLCSKFVSNSLPKLCPIFCSCWVPALNYDITGDFCFPLFHFHPLNCLVSSIMTFLGFYSQNSSFLFSLHFLFLKCFYCSNHGNSIEMSCTIVLWGFFGSRRFFWFHKDDPEVCECFRFLWLLFFFNLHFPFSYLIYFISLLVPYDLFYPEQPVGMLEALRSIASSCSDYGVHLFLRKLLKWYLKRNKSGQLCLALWFKCNCLCHRLIGFSHKGA